MKPESVAAECFTAAAASGAINRQRPAHLPIALAFLLLAGPGAACAKTIQVAISHLEYSPAAIEGEVGDIIEWVNKDRIDHTATVDGAWDVIIEAGKSGSLVLKRPGASEYYCRFHPNMRGRITVAPK